MMDFNIDELSDHAIEAGNEILAVYHDDSLSQ